MSATMQFMDAITLDTLREIGNIGAGNAMTALATMVNRTVDMSVPKVGVVQLSEFAQMTGGPEAPAIGIYMHVAGDAPGHVAFLMPENAACRLLDELLNRPLGATHTFEEMECSAMMEVGNIMASSYLMALCELTGLQLLSSPPGIAIDMTAAILSSLVSAADDMEDQALTIVTHIGGQMGNVDGYFIYIPEPGSLSIILRALQMEN